MNAAVEYAAPGTRVPNRFRAPLNGRKRTPTYRSWISMCTRCTNPRSDRWKFYGGRGIKVCKRWRESYDAFLADMGERPAGTTLDRIDNSGHYEPGNCRWADKHTQSMNTRTVRLREPERERIEQLRAQGLTFDQIAAAMGTDRTTAHHALAKHRARKAGVPFTTVPRETRVPYRLAELMRDRGPFKTADAYREFCARVRPIRYGTLSQALKRSPYFERISRGRFRVVQEQSA